jgi:hypothetical protein
VPKLPVATLSDTTEVARDMAASAIPRISVDFVRFDFVSR